MAAGKGKTKATLPVAGRTFYIDELEISKVKLKRLEKSLNLLGAKLEKFFTKDIFCLITDHAQPTDYKTESHSANGGSASTPSPFAATPGSVGTVSEGLSGKAAHSRGALMLTKSQEQNSRHSSVGTVSVSEQLVRNAKQWCIKIIRTDVALHWMEKKIHSLGLNKRRKKSSDRGERAPRHGGKVLKAPYVKIEDKTQSYRPIYRQFGIDAVPVLNTAADCCPFETRGWATAQANTAASQEEPSGNANTTLNTSKLEENGGKGKQMTKEKTNNVASKQPKGVQKKLTFCMVCKVRFEDLDQHLRSDQHRQFAEDDSNYEGVDNLVNSNACMERFLTDIMKYHSVHQKEGLAQQDKMIDSAITTASLAPASTSTVPDVLDTPGLPVNVVHRSVSDSEGSVTIPSHVEDDAALNDSVAQSPRPATRDASISVSDVPNISKVIIKAKCDEGSRVSYQHNSSIESDRASFAESHISPSEAVKLRKRRVTIKTNTKSPKKNSPGKRLSKTKKPNKKLNNLANIEANWLLLRDRKRDSNTSASVLPMDVSYGVLDESQLEVLAQQRASITAMEDDDKSLVQSIHDLLHDVAFESLNEGASKESDDPLLSCDSYINHKLSHTQQNSMLKPVSPKKSPRVCLGARDLPDEHFSPQKQRMSLSIEKERRHSESQVWQKKKVSKLDFDKPISESPSSLTENKENISDASSPYEALELSCINGDALHTGDDTKSENSRRIITSPNLPIGNATTHEQCMSTPASNNLTSTQIVCSTPTSNNFKQSFDSEQQSHITEANVVRAKRKFRQKCKSPVTFKQDARSMEYPDCFGFDETKTKESASMDNSIYPSRHTKFEYERQNSLLSFGSISLSQYDDVFSELPEMLGPSVNQSSIEKSPVKSHLSAKPPSTAVKKGSKVPGFKGASSVRKKAKHIGVVQQRQSCVDKDGTRKTNNKRACPASRNRMSKKNCLEKCEEGVLSEQDVVTRFESVDIQEHAPESRSASPTPSFRSLPDSTRDSIIRYKYDYAITPSRQPDSADVYITKKIHT